MGKIKIKKVGLEGSTESKKEKGLAKKKTVKVPGLKGGERVKVVTGVIVAEELPEEKPEDQETDKKEKPKEKKPEERAAQEPRVRGRKYKQARQLVDPTKLYSLDQALDLIKKTSITSFDGQVEVHLNLLPKLKGNKFSLTLPRPAGKKKIILAFGKGAKKAGADIEGDEKTIAEISRGFKDFTVVIATPDWMPKLTAIAKFLGPRGLMPNPKTGTVSDDLKEAIQKFKSAKMTLATEKKTPLIHTVIGLTSWPVQRLRENLDCLIKAVGETKIKKLTICASMGPGIKANFKQANQA